MKSRKMKSIVILFFLVIALVGLFGVYKYYWEQIPDAINLKAGSEQTIEFCVPVSGTIMPESIAVAGYAYSDRDSSLAVDFSKPFTIVTGDSSTYTARLKLFGFLPYKSVEIRVLEEEMLIPVGITVGIYVRTDGVLVIDTGEFEGVDGAMHAPAADVIMAGDYLLAVNGVALSGKTDFMNQVENCAGEALTVTLRRENETMDVILQPTENVNGEYKVGIWVRDSAQGIGTMTYLDAEGNFGALGHGITDYDIGELMEMENGQIYVSDIVSIQKGETGEPGEITGMIHYVQDNILGDIYENTSCGVYGNCYGLGADVIGDALPIAFKQEIRRGDAQILCNVSGTPEYYDIEILEINLSSTDNRGLVIKIVDEDLLAQTGGIVQGMSGSPIIQDGKIIGAVTHVLVNDPTKGYGIFIENMLEH